MNRFTRRVTQGMAATAVTGGLVMSFAGVAGASTLAAPSLGGRTASATRANRGVAPAPESTLGFNLINDSAETLNFVKTTGSLPAPPTAPLTAGQQVNFELPDPVWTDKYGSAYYNVMGANGTQIGTMRLDLDTSPSSTVTFYDMNGQPLTTMTCETGSNNGFDIYVEDAVGSPNTSQSLPAGSAAEQSFIQYVDTGTLNIKLGNTTWTLPGVTVYSAVLNTALRYSSSEVTGNVPLPAGTIQKPDGSLFNVNTGAVVNP
jgi:hypothetical protein